jgi:hypothetical protein
LNDLATVPTGTRLAIIEPCEIVPSRRPARCVIE